MKKLLLGVVIGVVIVVVPLFSYFWFGIAPSATAAPPMPFEKSLARAALHARMEREMPKAPPTTAPTEAQLLAGADIYAKDCAVCHGVPGGQKTAIAAGMYPRVPQLFEHGVDDDEPGESYWKIKNGIRLTGMPGYEKTRTDEQLWDVTYVLATKFDALPPSVQAALRGPTTVMPPPPAETAPAAATP